jgi:CheY-like chemotaxis protein
LIVEDDEPTASALVEFLRLAGYPSLRAGNGQEALDVLNGPQGPSICIVVIDLMMPVMDGWELRARMLADARLAALPVVVVTADTTTRRRDEVRAVRFFVKPIEPSLLLEAIAQYC